ncbi:autotransporter outer membrane beta-barrel domain-containing protein [Stenotrophomonas sp. Ste96]|uniref:autotransporter outer membrane beta-barrel domain-containing protein n=1 Tax=Stenotrophomonas sp. Ste96 TaxID=2926029 RepID=UPI0021C97578|nr:autotransporter outer membrane beta-barrel domain-containing protein [Stenotrophomonas sp. Ste96]
MFSGRDTSFNAWFNVLSGTEFDVAGQQVSKDNVRVFFGATYTASPVLTVYGNVTAERGGTGQSNAAGNVGFRWAVLSSEAMQKRKGPAVRGLFT